jgi:hypothetical protein
MREISQVLRATYIASFLILLQVMKRCTNNIIKVICKQAAE